MNITHQISTETDTPKSRGFKPLEREGFFIICTMDLYMTVESLFKYICDSFAGKECKTQEVVLVSVEFLKGQSAPARINGPTSTQA